MDWLALREQFPVTRRWAFFDHAAVAPISVGAQRALGEWAADIAENGHVNEPRWDRRVEDVRGLVGKLLNADPLDIAFIKNTSEGIGIVAEGLPWQPGDNIVTAAEEYPANIYPWMNLGSRGVQLRQVASKDGRLWIDDVRHAIDAKTRILSLSHVEFASGFRNDLDQLGALCLEKGVLFLVDAIQGLGALPIDVHKTPIDFLAADGHKWLLGPEGAGIFYMRRELIPQLRPIDIGWNSVVDSRNFSRIHFELKPHAGRYESGTLNVGGISALGASIELLLNIGLPVIARRLKELTDYLCDRMRGIGLEVYSRRRGEDWSGIVSVSAKDARTLVKKCRANNIVVNHRASRLRISPHCYNTAEEIDRMIEVLRSEVS